MEHPASPPGAEVQACHYESTGYQTLALAMTISPKAKLRAQAHPLAGMQVFPSSGEVTEVEFSVGWGLSVAPETELLRWGFCSWCPGQQEKAHRFLRAEFCYKLLGQPTVPATLGPSGLPLTSSQPQM